MCPQADWQAKSKPVAGGRTNKSGLIGTIDFAFLLRCSRSVSESLLRKIMVITSLCRAVFSVDSLGGQFLHASNALNEAMLPSVMMDHGTLIAGVDAKR